jgi:hypothetical protein
LYHPARRTTGAAMLSTMMLTQAEIRHSKARILACQSTGRNSVRLPGKKMVATFR